MTLVEFGENLRRQLGIARIIERESSSYVDGRCLLGRCLGVSVRICMTDDDDLNWYPFRINLKADGCWLEELEPLERLADILARKRTVSGFSVARCPDYGIPGAELLQYSLKAGASRRERHDNRITVTKPGTE